MKLIKQSFEILEQKDFSLIGIKKFIERCGRVCYKSEDKITDDSYEKFVDMLEKRDHARPLEFGTVHLKVPSGKEFKKLVESLIEVGLYNNMWIQYNVFPENTYITTNYRMYLRILDKQSWISEYFTEEDNCYYPSRYTVHMVLSRGVMDEFRTHVGLSHLAESTRYCNYSKDKFGGEITFVLPNWMPSSIWDENNKAGHIFLQTMKLLGDIYFDLLSVGETPQQARDVLPLAVKSELISCGFEDAWSNFFYRRCANDAHPMAREIAISLQERFKELGYVNQ